MINIEKKELAKKLGVKNILVNYFDEMSYKDSMTIILTDDLALNYVGRTYSFIPLTATGLGKRIGGRDVNKLLTSIKEDLKTKEAE